MIAHLFGTITEKLPASVIIDVHGVGYELILSAPDAERINLGDEVKFYTFHSLRENAEDLYGFTSLAAKKLFEMLISVNGIGPKAAISILSLGTPEEVRNAIANTDAAFISKAAGVGKKSAERVIVDLRDKVGLPSHYGATETKFTLQVVLRNIISTAKALQEMTDMISTDQSQRAALIEVLKYAIIVFGSLPVICLYPFVQKHFVKGVMIGSLKG